MFSRTVTRLPLRQISHVATRSLISRASAPASQRLVSMGTPAAASRAVLPRASSRWFHASNTRQAVVPFLLADIGEGIKECEVLQWFVKVGDTINEFDKVCEVQSDKATVEITSRFSGVVTKIYYKVGEMSYVGKPLVDIDTGSAGGAAAAAAPEAQGASAPSAAPSQQAEKKVESTHHEDDSAVFATPAVRRIAKENKVNLKLVKGTGKDGRITKEDVLNFVENKSAPAAQPAAKAAPAAAPAAAAPPQKVVYQREDRREPIKGFKKAMVKSMNEAWQKIPHFGYCDEIVMNELITFRHDLQEIAKERGVRLSFMPFFIKAASLALRQYPVLNSSVSADESELIYKGSHNIGLAMDTPAGLIVPNIKNVEEKTIFEIARDLNRLQELGSKGQLGPADLADGTFTISNIGTIGGTYTSPIIVHPQVCIGAVGKTQAVPRFDAKGHVYSASVMNVSWSADHRVIDGATMARFGTLWKTYLEKPKTMITDMK